METEQDIQIPEKALAALGTNEHITSPQEARQAAMLLNFGEELNLETYIKLAENEEAVLMREVEGFSLRADKKD